MGQSTWGNPHTPCAISSLLAAWAWPWPPGQTTPSSSQSSNRSLERSIPLLQKNWRGSTSSKLKLSKYMNITNKICHTQKESTSSAISQRKNSRAHTLVSRDSPPPHLNHCQRPQRTSRTFLLRLTGLRRSSDEGE